MKIREPKFLWRFPSILGSPPEEERASGVESRCCASISTRKVLPQNSIQSQPSPKANSPDDWLQFCGSVLIRTFFVAPEVLLTHFFTDLVGEVRRKGSFGPMYYTVV